MAFNGPYPLTVFQGGTLILAVQVDDTLDAVAGVGFRFRVWPDTDPASLSSAIALSPTPTISAVNGPPKVVTVTALRIALSSGKYRWELFCDLSGSEGPVAWGSLLVVYRPVPLNV